ncbi:uncharacterized protein BXZ73DRAFT_87486 [Epithele typhae]|uniref:uncharacterized protein n=1 Tax=Epithele typhae TaxID=378194 RepID=UPI00200848AB|nr:uncharacterized protein BXZ73DRAFT_87486 [Epithele typhae]KAH9943053.1 hypothetical protein BXZ73DRAFT_87486 [Epithele typhae]
MSKPAIIPETTTAGIAVDPRTLERVIPESRRLDGTVRKQIKIRPGFTPQEDVRRFRGTRQAQADATTLPKGHIIGWTPPSAAASTPGAGASKAGLSKAQKKNEKRKEKRKEKRDEKVKDNWDDDDDDDDEGEGEAEAASSTATPPREGAHTAEKPNWAVAQKADAADAVADKLGKLEVR